MQPSVHPPTRAPVRKPTLFCAVCGHKSVISGDWTIRVDDDVDVYECPDCESTITVRPRPEESTDGSDRRLGHLQVV